jgi:hypothetical protein
MWGPIRRKFGVTVQRRRWDTKRIDIVGYRSTRCGFYHRARWLRRPRARTGTGPADSEGAHCRSEPHTHPTNTYRCPADQHTSTTPANADRDPTDALHLDFPRNQRARLGRWKNGVESLKGRLSAAKRDDASGRFPGLRHRGRPEISRWPDDRRRGWRHHTERQFLSPRIEALRIRGRYTEKGQLSSTFGALSNGNRFVLASRGSLRHDLRLARRQFAG